MKTNKTKKSALPEKRRKYDHTPGWLRAVMLPVLALALTLLIEAFNRASLTAMLEYAVVQERYFALNWLIVFTTLTFSELFKHRMGALFTLSVGWAGLGIAQFFVVRERIQPFTSMDILMMKDAVKLTTLYYTWPEIILMCAGGFLGVAVFIAILTRMPKRRRVNYRFALTSFSGLVILTFCILSLCVSNNIFPRHFESLVDAYEQYGFATCFTLTFGDMGVAQPEEYSAEVVTDIVDDIDNPGQQPDEPHAFDESDDLSRPNVIFVQLESFIDAEIVRGAEYSEHPTPNFSRLISEYPSGELYVPSIGGGTVNVEFEILSGLNLDFFGAGEYPYSTILQEKTCETIAYNLREQGYSTTAMHNHTGTFYSRHEVYSRLGFEKFVPLEYMPYATYSGIGWAEDIILADEILKALNASGERDFVMAISVESHGKYEEEYAYSDGDVEILALPEQISRNRFANYLHLIRQTDEFIGSLISELEKYPEPVVCVFYGDHLPALDLSEEILTTGNVYASCYVIWNNFGAEFEAPDLQAYRLSANLLKQLGVSGGVISKFHQAAELSPDPESEYFTGLEMLEYDLLYGDQSAYEDGNPYEPLDLQLGSRPVEIISAANLYGRVLVSGQNFTEYSVILIDGVAYPTAFITDRQVIAVVPRTTPVTAVAVAQVAPDGTELGRTEEVTVGGNE